MGVVVKEPWQWEGGRRGLMGVVWGGMRCEDGRGVETREELWR